MKRSIFTLVLVSALTVSQTTTPLPSKMNMAGIACLAGAGILAAKNGKAVKKNVVPAAKAAGEGIKYGTEASIDKAKDWAKNDPYAELKIGVGLATAGGLFLIPYKSKIIKGIGTAALTALCVDALSRYYY